MYKQKTAVSGKRCPAYGKILLVNNLILPGQSWVNILAKTSEPIFYKRGNSKNQTSYTIDFKND